jgi:hypothetical protein
MKTHALAGDLFRGGHPGSCTRYFTRDDFHLLKSGIERYTIRPEFGERFITDPKKPQHSLGRTYPELSGDRGRRRDEPGGSDRFRECAFEFARRAAEPADVPHADKCNASGTHNGEVACRAGLWLVGPDLSPLPCD